LIFYHISSKEKSLLHLPSGKYGKPTPFSEMGSKFIFRSYTYLAS
jgi:hypothetical protein